MPVDRYGAYPAHEVGSPTKGVAVVPNDGADLADTSLGVYIGGAGNMKVTMMDGGDITFVGLAAGDYLPIRVTRIWATGTTATNILALS